MRLLQLNLASLGRGRGKEIQPQFLFHITAGCQVQTRTGKAIIALQVKQFGNTEQVKNTQLGNLMEDCCATNVHQPAVYQKLEEEGFLM